MSISNEAKYMDFNDKRLNKRLNSLVDILAKKPSCSIPKACGSPSQAKAAYRFLDNDKVESKNIREGFAMTTKNKIKNTSEVLFISDATGVNYSSHKKLKGVGVLKNSLSRGLNLHTTLAVTADGLILGSVDQMCWGRKPEDYGRKKERWNLPIEKKESYKWIESFNRAQESLPDKTQGIFIGDRGADIFELFLQPRKQNMHLLIRSAYNRKLADNPNKLFEELKQQPSMGNMQVKVKRSNERKERIANLEIRFLTATILSPAMKKKLGLAVTLNIVLAQEVASDSHGEELIEWKLLTTLPINNLDDAIRIVKTYALRWLIERFHYTLKSGCKIEQLELEDAIRIDKAIALYTIVAIKIMELTYLARISPNASCDAILKKEEWEALCCYINRTPIPPLKPPTVYEAACMIAKIGGFLGRKGDGFPGVKVIWSGLQSLQGIVATYCIFKGKHVGNA